MWEMLTCSFKKEAHLLLNHPPTHPPTHLPSPDPH